MSIFITGASGFLGTQVTRLVLEQTDQPIIVLVRGETAEEAFHRLERAWWDCPQLAGELGKRITVVQGDLGLSKVGLTETDYEELISSVSHIIHLAADIRLNESIDALRRANVEGVSNLLDFAYDADRHHRLTRLSYVSTAYVAGGRKGSVPEEDLTDRFGFSNNYEFSKYEGETLIRKAGEDLPVSIFRPGMVVGDSKSGAVKTFNTLYFPLRLYLTGKLKVLPVNPAMKVNLVPCDYVAEAIASLTFEPEAQGRTFHLTLPAAALPSVVEMIQFTRLWASDQLHLRLPAPVFLPVPIRCFQWLGRFFKEKSAVRSLLSLASYFKEDRVYQRDNLDKLCGIYQGNWREFFPQLLSYAADRGFLHNSERNVHEQAYFRLSGKSRPVKFHDVVSGSTIDRNQNDVACEIETVVSAMKQMGIQSRDRVAIVGYNSSRYFAIDAAIGLCGAVSVPLYYSSPVGELIEIIENSGSRLIFVSLPEILKKLADHNLQVPVVSFCREIAQEDLADEELAEKESPASVITWNDFINSGVPAVNYNFRAAALKSPTGFGDIATLRYTSGTTGRPKGAVFDHANLRCMAETLASLPPWKARTERVVYLSFLPMNHVVEGILASYAVFFTPAPVDIYYLEDFQELQKALPRIRPTVFFSVPRFYEKLWEHAARSFIGRIWLRSQNGAVKTLLGHMLRMAVSRKAGIDRCKQLIVGSAPVSAELLQNFRNIGIEVHNAYGLTEAPLITLNRFMRNRIGTVGEALPATEIRIADDGEIMVKGPQVMRGYYKDAEMDGWLHTGDLGSLSDDNYLTILGRKKECMINSYGKNINPVKIELMLREATGVNHIVVIGDNRSYCTALFFGCQAYDPAVNATVEAGIQSVNEQLSHPEQIKGWSALTENLSITGGDLTANLKVRRAVVMQKYGDIISTLYGNAKN